MSTFFKSFLLDESGATAIEYGLIATLVSIAAIVSLSALGSSLDSIYVLIDSAITTVATP